MLAVKRIQLHNTKEIKKANTTPLRRDKVGSYLIIENVFCSTTLTRLIFKFEAQPI